MIQRLLPAVVLAGLVGNCLFGQGMNTKASKNDWEEINFEFNSSVLTDGYPSLLRIADLLKAHPDFKIKVVGNTDSIGSNRYNDKLSVARANTVAQFLQKYGASAGQIQVSGEGKKDPEVPNSNKLGRWINRRVVMTVTGPNGNVIAEGGAPEVINDFEAYARKQLSKLDQLQGILDQLKALQDQVNALKTGEDTILASTKEIKTDTVELVKRPPPLTYQQTDEIAHRAADYALTQAALRNRKYSVLGANVGPSFLPGRPGNFSASLYGKFLVPFGNGKTPDMDGTHAVQIDGEMVYFPYVTDAQINGGVVERFGAVQAGAFASFLHSSFRNYHGGGAIGEGAFTLDWVFSGGKIGLFAAKGFRNYAVINRGEFGNGSLPPAYVRVQDQGGFQATAALFGDTYMEGALAFKKSVSTYFPNRPYGMLRFVIPVGNMFAITAEGSVNTTFMNVNDSGRVVFGFEFGNWLHPKDYGDTTAPVPTTVPRMHYQLIQR